LVQMPPYGRILSSEVASTASQHLIGRAAVKWN
jgi:hypothetical protein